MKKTILTIPLIFGFGWFTGYYIPEPELLAQRGVNRPAGHPTARPAPTQAPRPNTPTFSRPQVQQPRPLPAVQPSQPIGVKPALPTTRPSNPNPNPGNIARPNIPNTGNANRPTTLPGVGSGASRPNVTNPIAKPTPLPGNTGNGNNVGINRPGGNGNGSGNGNNVGINRPGGGNNNNSGNTNIGVNRPGNTNNTTVIGNKPNINVNKPNVNVNKPNIGSGNTNIGSGNVTNNITNIRPQINTRPGILPNGNHNTIINNTTIVNNNNRVNNIHVNNFNNVNRPGYGYGAVSRPWVSNQLGYYHNNWNAGFIGWNNNYHPWYHGYWNGYWNHNWGFNTGVAVGISLWSLNSIGYQFGYYHYYNPFYVPPTVVVQPVYLNYAQPIVPITQTYLENQAPPPMPQAASAYMDQAQKAFKSADYNTALKEVDEALKLVPNDTTMHEFRAQVLFALGQYQNSAAVVHNLLSSTPGWDYTTLQSLYPNNDAFLQQLQSLKIAWSAKPDDPALNFLLAYQYMTMGDADKAREHLERAAKKLPSDNVTNQLLKTVQSSAPPTPAPNGTNPTTPPATTPTIPPVEPPIPKKEEPAKPAINLDMKGNWSAKGPDGNQIGLSISEDGKFNWTVDSKGKKDSFDGTFTLDGDVLMLERKEGGALMGKTTPLADNKFKFKAVGSPDSDPGLIFEK